MILPSDIRRFASHGTGDMGAVGDRTNMDARFSLDCCDGYVLADVMVRNTGGSAGRADLSMRIDHRLGPAYDFTPIVWKDFGNGAATDKGRIKLVIEDWESRAWSYLRDPATGILDELVFEWTNPNTQAWAIDIGLVDLNRIQ